MGRSRDVRSTHILIKTDENENERLVNALMVYVLAIDLNGALRSCSAFVCTCTCTCTQTRHCYVVEQSPMPDFTANCPERSETSAREITTNATKPNPHVEQVGPCCATQTP